LFELDNDDLDNPLFGDEEATGIVNRLPADFSNYAHERPAADDRLTESGTGQLLREACPSATIVSVGAAIGIETPGGRVAELAEQAHTQLCSQQEAIKTAAADAQPPTDARNRARRAFIEATATFAEAMSEEGPLAARAAQAEAARASSPAAEAEHTGWRDVYQLLQHLQIARTACARIESANEPAAAEAEYTRLESSTEKLRTELKASHHRIELLEVEAGDDADEPEPEPDAQPAQAQLAAAVQQARDELQAVPMVQWSEEQVTTWAGVLGLPPASVTAVQEALGNTDGEELQVLLPKSLVKLLSKVQSPGAADAASLADQVLEQRNVLLASASSEPSPRLRCAHHC
jgi:hypothetical protein